MSRTLRSEWIKFTTVTTHWVLAVLAFIFPVAVTVLTAIFMGTDGLDRRTVVAPLTGASFLSLLVFMVLGILSITSDYAHQTIRPTFAATPHRMRVMTAKAVVVAAVALVVELLVLVIGYVAGSLIVNGRRSGLASWSYSEGRVMILATLVLAPLAAIVGLGAGGLIRNQAAAITVMLVWQVIGEGLISGLLGLVHADSLRSMMPFGAAVRAINGNDGDTVLWSRGPSMAVFVVFAALMFALGSWRVQQRDA